MSQQPPLINPNDFDPETGLLVEDKQIEQTVRDFEKVLEQRNAFVELKSTRGWAILEKFVQNTVQLMTNDLKIEKDFEKIKRLQSEIIAFETLFNIIEVSFEDAKEAEKKLNEIVGP